MINFVRCRREYGLRPCENWVATDVRASLNVGVPGGNKNLASPEPCFLLRKKSNLSFGTSSITLRCRRESNSRNRSFADSSVSTSPLHHRRKLPLLIESNAFKKSFRDRLRIAFNSTGATQSHLTLIILP